jgi:hypothetical protein
MEVLPRVLRCHCALDTMRRLMTARLTTRRQGIFLGLNVSRAK